MTPKIGDIVHVRATVADVASDSAVNVMLRGVNGNGHKTVLGGCFVPPSSIIAIEPRPLAVGDKIYDIMTDSECEVLAIHKGDVALKCEYGIFIRSLTKLRPSK